MAGMARVKYVSNKTNLILGIKIKEAGIVEEGFLSIDPSFVAQNSYLYFKHCYYNVIYNIHTLTDFDRNDSSVAYKE